MESIDQNKSHFELSQVSFDESEMIGNLDSLVLNVYQQDEIQRINDKKSNQLTKAQKKQRARDKCQEYKLQNQLNSRKDKQAKKIQNFISQLDSDLTEEQKTQAIKQKKKQSKEGALRLKLACQNDQTGKIIVDLAYSDQMSQIEKKSLSSQINMSVYELRKYNDPMALHIVNLNEYQTIEGLKARSYESWGIIYHETYLKESFIERIEEMKNDLNHDVNSTKFSIDWNKTFYLSPDAKEPLLDFDDSTNFIIGGLIDRTVIKYASLLQSNQYQIEARRLPIEEFCKEKVIKKALSINQVVSILMIYKESKDWSKAFDEAIPQRVKIAHEIPQLNDGQ
eukprot:403338147